MLFHPGGGSFIDSVSLTAFSALRYYGCSSTDLKVDPYSTHSNWRLLLVAFASKSVLDWVTEVECIYHDQIDDQMLRRPDGRPDHSRRPDRWPDSHSDQNVKIRSAIWSSDEACFSSHLFKRHMIFAQKAQLQSNLVTQERSGCPEAIWSPIRSPGHLVVDLVVVDAFSLSEPQMRKLLRGMEDKCAQVAKRLTNDWLYSCCMSDVIDGICMTSLPVFSQTFGYPSLIQRVRRCLVKGCCSTSIHIIPLLKITCYLPCHQAKRWA